MLNLDLISNFEYVEKIAAVFDVSLFEILFKNYFG